MFGVVGFIRADADDVQVGDVCMYVSIVRHQHTQVGV